MALDTQSPGALRRLSALRAERGAEHYLVEDNSRGEDRSGSLSVEVDPTGWVVDAWVDRVDDRLRTPPGLVSALREAYTVAEQTRRRRNVRLRGLTPEEIARGDEILTGERRLRPPPWRKPGPMTLPAGRVDPPVRGAEPRPRTMTGTSRARELTVTATRLGAVLDVTVDEEWLRQTGPDMLRYALREAFRALYDQGENR